MAEWPKYDKRRIGHLHADPHQRQVVMGPDGKVGYSFPGSMGTPEGFFEAYQENLRDAEVFRREREGQFPQMHTEQQFIALFMFGPMHGKSMRLGQSVRNEVMLACPPKVEPRFEPLESREEVLKHMRINMPRNHRYRRLDQFSSAQGEDVTLYIHSEDCCDEMLSE